MLRTVLIIVIVLITIIMITDICKKKNKTNEKFKNDNNEENKIYKSNSITKEQQLNPIIIQNIMNDDYFVSGISNANNVGLRARVYNNFKPDNLDMKNVKNDMK